VCFVFLDVLATGAFLVIPESPMFHHFAHAEEAADMFRHPKLIERGKV
jgi:hypothetical protein